MKDECVCDCAGACGSDELAGSDVLLTLLESSAVAGTVPAGRIENMYGFTNARGVKW